MGNNNDGKVEPNAQLQTPQKMDTADQESLEVSATSSKVRLQPFWPLKAHNWFLLGEIQFNLQVIKSEKQKFLLTLSTLSPETCDNISDFLTEPPDTEQYTKLKRVLLDRLAPSTERQLEDLITGQDIGDRRPSDALRHIRTLAGTNLNAQVIKSLWIRKMPEIIKIALVAQPESIGTDALAKTADKMYEIINIGQQNANVSQVSYRQSRPPARTDRGPLNNQKTSTLETRMARLESKLDGLFRERGQSKGRRESSRSRSRARNSSNYSRRHGRCWYHVKFGKAAKKCIPPCDFTTSQQSTSHNANKMDVIEENTKNYQNAGSGPL